jgi:GntR family transcriptional regulator
VSLNPADPRPRYQQLAALLREQIESGDLPEGERVPTETELAERYGASRNTVRLALARLRAEGLLTSHQGKGSFVRSAQPIRYYASLSGSRRRRLDADRRMDTFGQQITSLGKVPKQVSTTEVLAADDEIADHLGLESGDEVGVRRRVQYADDQPIQIGNSYYPYPIVQGSKIMDPQDIVEGTDQVLEDLGYIPAFYEDEITWRMPTSGEATKLHLEQGIPVGRLLRTSYGSDDRPIEVYEVIMPANLHVLLYEVSAE